jgi:hypothetical protein
MPRMKSLFGNVSGIDETAGVVLFGIIMKSRQFRTLLKFTRNCMQLIETHILHLLLKLSMLAMDPKSLKKSKGIIQSPTKKFVSSSLGRLSDM